MGQLVKYVLVLYNTIANDIIRFTGFNPLPLKLISSVYIRVRIYFSLL